MTLNDSKPYLSYLNKLVDQYSNAYHHSINKNPINTDYSALNEKIETNIKAPKFKFNEFKVIQNQTVMLEIKQNQTCKTMQLKKNQIMLHALIHLI